MSPESLQSLNGGAAAFRFHLKTSEIPEIYNIIYEQKTIINKTMVFLLLHIYVSNLEMRRLSLISVWMVTFAIKMLWIEPCDLRGLVLDARATLSAKSRL